ncbi:MAG: branched-chain amino acid transport system II carrier protein [Peptoniphilaceae bacterium]|uniref:branched-chain amino acid transport system II carrier protein n=1 Tax=Parvimonas sp. TaxID=1944660 RepID=UPI0025F1E469|nr:branched-chain amino acid transport system II carrier protein [Parvimonas sp.]MCI5997585.1 branched-chain amino acid transport system II carrier protein [Parvimonas sp.]MDD7765180.1 branched-chain amino acid transport system II carrier protein [Peptoniphilaceae bacterium]MDY3051203.1 branched-chain amino acid transport system II carrier protein [Parvimonas sp.]
MKKETRLVFVIGFSLFAMFFGAGNLIFPTYLGYSSGTYWPVAFILYMIADGLLAMISLYCVFCMGGITEFVRPLGKYLGTVILVCISLCIGPLVAIPRTGAITYNLGVANFGFNNLVVTTAIFFILTYLICIKSEKIVDFIGRYLTPTLLAFLIIMVITGIISPVGEIQPGENLQGVMYESFINGFQTLDGLGAGLFNAVIVNALIFYKIKKEREKKMIFKSSIVAFICLSVVYGGLCYLGASSKLNIDGAKNGTVILLNFTNLLFGRSGILMLSVIVILACLTTSTALAGGVAEYFSELIPSISYKIWLAIICFVSFIFSCFGVDTIIEIAIPLLFTLYPPVIILILTSVLRNKINCNNAIRYSAILSIIIGFMTVLSDKFGMFQFVKVLPLSSLGFAYLIPAAILFTIIALFEKNMGSNIDTPKILNTRITLHDEDVKMLYYISEKLDEPKSEAIRKSIKALYSQLKDE